MVDLTKKGTCFSSLGDFSREQKKFPIFFMKHTDKTACCVLFCYATGFTKMLPVLQPHRMEQYLVSTYTVAAWSNIYVWRISEIITKEWMPWLILRQNLLSSSISGTSGHKETSFQFIQGKAKPYFFQGVHYLAPYMILIATTGQNLSTQSVALTSKLTTSCLGPIISINYARITQKTWGHEKNSTPPIYTTWRNLFQTVIPGVTYCISVWGSRLLYITFQQNRGNLR